MEKIICKRHTHCRACGSDNLVKYISLGDLPLANNLEDTQEKAINAEKYPLEVLLCKECSLSQLSVVIDPEKLFSYYTYRSGVSKGYIDHCRKMAKDLKEKYNLNKDSFVVDIAGNDGTLLKEFKEEIGCDVLNVDPAENLTEISRNNGIPAYTEFWSSSVGKAIKNQADVIIATNVFAHVNDLIDFLQGAKIALKSNGVLIIECPYIGDHLENLEYAQIYFEHLSYMSVSPIYDLCKQIDLKLIDVERQEIHSGTIRLTITHNDSSLEGNMENVGRYLDEEYDKKYGNFKTYLEWADNVYRNIEDLSYELSLLKYKKLQKLAGFSCSAKGNTLLNSLGFGIEEIDYIVDETIEKIGKYSPGTGIPIVGMDELLKNPPDYLLILAWNFKNEIMEKVRKLGYKGKFLCPIPKFQIIE